MQWCFSDSEWGSLGYSCSEMAAWRAWHRVGRSAVSLMDFPFAFAGCCVNINGLPASLIPFSLHCLVNEAHGGERKGNVKYFFAEENRALLNDPSIDSSCGNSSCAVTEQRSVIFAAATSVHIEDDLGVQSFGWVCTSRTRGLVVTICNPMGEFTKRLACGPFLLLCGNN